MSVCDFILHLFSQIFFPFEEGNLIVYIVLILSPVLCFMALYSYLDKVAKGKRHI